MRRKESERRGRARGQEVGTWKQEKESTKEKRTRLGTTMT